MRKRATEGEQEQALWLRACEIFRKIYCDFENKLSFMKCIRVRNRYALSPFAVCFSMAMGKLNGMLQSSQEMRTSRANKYNKCECGIGMASGESNIRNGTVDWRQAHTPNTKHSKQKKRQGQAKVEREKGPGCEWHMISANIPYNPTENDTVLEFSFCFISIVLLSMCYCLYSGNLSQSR